MALSEFGPQDVGKIPDGWREMVFTAATVFHHSNVELPLGLERLINTVFVTPRMHGIHHSVIVGESNDNCSVIFSWWDRLHRTLRLNVPQVRVRIGAAGLGEAQSNRVLRLLALPLAGPGPREPEAPSRPREDLDGPDRRVLAP